MEVKPAVPVKKSVTPEYIICLEDGKKFKSLKRHLRTHYDMSPEEYREKWGLARDYPMVAPAYATARSNLAKSMGLGRRAQGEAQAGMNGSAQPEAEPGESQTGRGCRKGRAEIEPGAGASGTRFSSRTALERLDLPPPVLAVVRQARPSRNARHAGHFAAAEFEKNAAGTPGRGVCWTSS